MVQGREGVGGLPWKLPGQSGPDVLLGKMHNFSYLSIWIYSKLVCEDSLCSNKTLENVHTKNGVV